MKLLAVAALTLSPSVLAQEASVPPEDRYDDLQLLVERMREMHPNLFFGVGEEEFQKSVDALEDRLGELTDDEFAVELMRLVGLLSRSGREGHAVVLPVGRFTMLPIRAYSFEEGWYVIAAREPHEALVGERIVAIGGVPVQEVADRVAPLIAFDNEHDLRSKVSIRALMPELLHVLGIGDERGRATLLLTDGENGHEVTLEGIPFGEFQGWRRSSPGPLPAVGDTLWLSDPTTAWWMHVLEDERALYAQYNRVQTSDATVGSLADFAAELVRTFEEQGLERLILDVRLNGGGDNTTFGPLVAAIRGSEAINQRGRLYGLVGRHTFSAAGNFVTVLERDTEVILVGEPTGGAPNQYGDARNVALPHHPWMLVRIATRYHEIGGAEDARLTHTPESTVSPTATDYFAGRDTALESTLQ